MLSVNEAVDLVCQHARRLSPRRVNASDALGCILGEPVTADRDAPPFARSIVDGYAIRSADAAAGKAVLRITHEVLAGTWPDRAVGPGEAILVMTGAPMPDGGDAVVMLERGQRRGDSVELDDPQAVRPGQNWVPVGREYAAGAVLIESGVTLSPVHLALMAAVGWLRPLVVPRPRVAIVTTGDEIVSPDQWPERAQIRDANGSLLGSLCAQADCPHTLIGCVPDRLPALVDELQRALEQDIVLISGGVSAGTRDLVPEVLESLGVRRVFHKVNVKPGKPIWFGVGPERSGPRPGQPLVFGLPGNPLSALVCFLLFVRAALAALGGHMTDESRVRRVRLATALGNRSDRQLYHPARLVADPVTGVRDWAEPLDLVGSADLRTMARADGFLILPSGAPLHEPSWELEFLPWPERTS